MKRKHLISLSVILTFSLLLSACGALGLGAAPTPDPLAVQATIDAVSTFVVQTVSVDLTSTAAMMPTSTFTPEPTETPAITATLQPTATVEKPTATKMVATVVPTKTLTATPAAYACKLISTSPTAGTKIKISTDFDATWIVQNVGTKIWENGYVDLKYVSGTKMQTGADIFDVPSAVVVGGELTLVVDMKAPATAGKYDASWVITMEGTTLCTLPVNIEAVNP